MDKGTIYFVRAFVSNASETNYSDQLIFTTHAFANGVEVLLKYVGGGHFRMGATHDQQICYGDEMPVHEVHVDSFQMSQYEITTRQYCAFLNQVGAEQDDRYRGDLCIDISDPDCPVRYLGSKFVSGRGKWNCPVTEVTWFGAQAFCQWMGGRLPTEAEWEFACRGGNKSKDYKYSGGNDPGEVAWFSENSKDHSHPVGQKAPNELGLYDMSGNAWEWCYDWYGFDYYNKSPDKNPSGLAEGQTRIM